MRRPIRQLAPQLASLIAAGEVIKRPEDIIRELIDNGVDAGASQIDICIEQGGLEKIQIRDNGIGIPYEELPLALMRHATSKIQGIEDIACVQTLGFRGEALASMGAVARVQLASRVEGNTHGWEITAEPGQSLSTPKPIAHPIGTTITVTELFYHLPARRRFLRTAATEFARIHHGVKCLSVSHANIRFNLEHNKRPILQCPLPREGINPQLSRVATLYNPAFAESAIPIDQKAAQLALSGWISPPSFSRNQADWQYFYVNRRLIKDKALNHAVKQAYQEVLYRGRQPVVVLFLEIDSAEVDVNVHPTKAEVRFRQPQLIYEFLYKNIKQALASTRHRTFDRLTVHHSSGASTDAGTIWHPTVLPSRTQPFPKTPTAESSLLQGVSIDTNITPTKKPGDIPQNPQQTQLVNPLLSTEPLGYALAQLHMTYILAQNDKGLIIIDAHAAHERILYEELKQAFDQKTPQAQRLLIPLTLPLTAEAIEMADRHYPLFQQVGFEYEKSGLETLVIKTIPQALANIPPDRLIPEILSDLQEHGLSKRLEEQRNRLLAAIACRSATQANRTMSLHEMNQLLRRMETTPHSGQCNHGRPTWRQITLNELNSWFLRGR